MGFHRNIITRGIYGEISKVREELEEAEDAIKQGQTLMLLVELSDIVGACAGVAAKHGLTIHDLVAFAQLRSKVAMEEEAVKSKQPANDEPALPPLAKATKNFADYVEWQRRKLHGSHPSSQDTMDDSGMLEAPDQTAVTTVITPVAGTVLGPVVPKCEF